MGDAKDDMEAALKINPDYAPAMLGMARVMNEAFDMWHHPKMRNDYSRVFSDWWARDVDAMVRKDRNHPSVIMYSIGNEIPDTGNPSGARTGRAICERIRALGMRFNAGHALNYFNVQPVAALPGVRELHIGHAIVSRALFVGLREAVREMKALMLNARQ